MPVNSHIVPQFILRQFGEHITCFNWTTGELKEDRNPRTVFSEMGFYPDDLEKEMNEKCEVRFSPVLRELLSAKNEIKLNRQDIWEIKRFLLITMLRSRGMMERIKHERKVNREELSVHPAEVIKELGWRIYETESKETDYDYWVRSIKGVLEEPTGSPIQLEMNKTATSTAVLWSRTFNAGYLAFWDAPEGESFFIGDSGVYREPEKREMVHGQPNMKLKVLNGLLKDTPDENKEKISSLNRIIGFNLYFWDNLLLFPVSSKRIIVLINPFFKCVHNEFNQIVSEHKSFPDIQDTCDCLQERFLWPITNIYRKELTAPNQNEYTGIGYLKSDRFTYHPEKLKPDELHYLNVLIMSQTCEWLGFSKAEEILPSLRFCRERVGTYVENDPYLKLLKIVERKTRPSSK